MLVPDITTTGHKSLPGLCSQLFPGLTGGPLAEHFTAHLLRKREQIPQPSCQAMCKQIGGAGEWLSLSGNDQDLSNPSPAVLHTLGTLKLTLNSVCSVYPLGSISSG